MAASRPSTGRVWRTRLLRGSQCSQDVFHTDGSLIDVVAEYQAYIPSVDASADATGTTVSAVSDPTTVPPESKANDCGGYRPAFDLPLKPCDAAITVSYVQHENSSWPPSATRSTPTASSGTPPRSPFSSTRRRKLSNQMASSAGSRGLR